MKPARTTTTTSAGCTSARALPYRRGEREITFRDLFSRQSQTYAATRPSYPSELYEFIASLTARRRVVWDCGTGSGQAAKDLARYFERVIATDASGAQLRHAPPVGNVEYRVASAESSGLEARSVDATTVAQALHWFDLAAFYNEVRRVTVPGGVIAAWSYGQFRAGDDIEAWLRDFEHGTLGPYWDAGRRWVDEGYRTIPFPFEELSAPAFQLRVEWTLSHLGGYLRSWSAVAKFVRERGEDPVAPLLKQLVQHWGPPERTRTLTWPLAVRIGRI